mmetsp:Transcript_25553/g.49992  ORF Transcript_25553/g.49992 Transcript_25553/m.49992 type:complete len:81 (-) Transcript_25553:29-271(-)
MPQKWSVRASRHGARRSIVFRTKRAVQSKERKESGKKREEKRHRQTKRQTTRMKEEEEGEKREQERSRSCIKNKERNMNK